MRRTRGAGLAAGALGVALAVSLTGCGGSSPAAQTPSLVNGTTSGAAPVDGPTSVPGSPSTSGVPATPVAPGSTAPGVPGATTPGAVAPPVLTPGATVPPSTPVVPGQAVLTVLASGQVVKVAAGRATVTGRGRQSTVSFDSATTIVDLTSITRKQVGVGACILAFPPNEDAAGPRGFTAALVRVVAPTGNCQSDDASGSGTATASPTASPSPGGGPGTSDHDTGSGGPDHPGTGHDGSNGSYVVSGGGIVGAVTAVTGRGFDVRVDGRDQPVVVATTAATRYTSGRTATGEGSGATIKRGQCLVAYGLGDGAATAVRIRLSAPVRGRCAGVAG